MCNIFHGEVNQLIDVSTSYFHFLLLLFYFLLCLLRFECASRWLEMATLKHLLTGRKRDSDVWKNFEYLPDRNKSKCMVTVGENKICGFEVTGKNTTNLKSHLQNRHKDVYKETVENDAEKKAEKTKLNIPGK